MTDEAYRRQGLARKLIEHVVKQYKDSCDGFYLFANLDALDFYDKCGFSRETEYQYKVKEEFCRNRSKGEWFVPVNTADVQMKQKYMDMIRHSAANSSMEQINKFGLQMFYTADMENVYYAKDMDCFIVAETEGDTLLLQSIICENQVALSDVLQRVRGEYHKRQLGFAPGSEGHGYVRGRAIRRMPTITGCFYFGEAAKKYREGKTLFSETFTCIKTDAFWYPFYAC